MTTVQLFGEIQAANLDQRTISGRLVTWGETGSPQVGPTFRMAAGAVRTPDNLGEIVLNVEHSKDKPIGRLMLASTNDQGFDGVFHLVNTTMASDMIVEAKAGLRTGFSVEGNIVKARRAADGVVEVTEFALTGAALTVAGALPSSQVYEIAASLADEVAPEMSVEESPETAPLPPQEEVVENTTPAEVVEASVLEVVPTAPLVKAAAKPLPSVGEVLAAAREGRIEAVVDPQIISENPGIVPAPILGPVIDTYFADRPVVNSARRLAMPSAGKTFTRPKITQHSLVGLQAAELDALVGQPLTIESLTVTKKTAGCQLPISVQDRDWTDPAILSLITNDMAKVMANFTEASLCSALVAATVQEQALPADADAAEFTTAIFGAAEQVIAAVGDKPNVIFASVDQWARIGALVDSSLRPLFPSVGAVNANGSMTADSFAVNAWGLPLVVSRQFADGTLIVGNSAYLEYYEDAAATMQLPDPSSLSFTVSMYRYFSHLVTEADAFVALKPAV